MTYEVLARKWRPQVFEDVIGQKHITQTLTNALKTGRLAHAYLFGGPRGVGKTSVARILAKAINCEQGDPGIPCNTCQSCLEITDGSSVDVQEIDGASNRGIDEIRELREYVKYSPSSSKYRIYIIDEVHMLTMPAFNALLKTLEEPPPHVKFIFATTESHKVPVTILSRCQRFDFKRIPPTEIVVHLKRIAEEEAVEVSESGLILIAKEAEGSMRDAESLLDQVISFSGEKIKEGDIRDILGVMDADILFDTSRAVIDGSSAKCLDIIDQIYRYGYDMKEFYWALMGQFRDLLVCLISPENHLLDMGEVRREETEKQAKIAGVEKLQMMLNFMINREEDVRYASHPRLALEAVLMKLCHLGDWLSFDDLIKKIGSLEERLVSLLANGTEYRIGQVNDQPSEWTLGRDEKVRIEGKETDEEGKTWNDFMSFLSSKSKPVFNILKHWHFVKMTDRELEIARSDQSFAAGYFDDKERYEQLSKYCSDFFKRPINIRISKNHKTPKSNDKTRRKVTSVEETKKDQDFSKPVQDILEMFQGEIKERNPADKTTGT